MVRSKLGFSGLLVLAAFIVSGVSFAVEVPSLLATKGTFFADPVMKLMGTHPELRSKIGDYLGKTDFKGSREDVTQLWNDLRAGKGDAAKRAKIIEDLNGRLETYPSEQAKINEWLKGQMETRSGKFVDEGKVKTVSVDVDVSVKEAAKAAIDPIIIQNAKLAGATAAETNEAVSGANNLIEKGIMDRKAKSCFEKRSGDLVPLQSDMAILKAGNGDVTVKTYADKAVKAMHDKVYPEETVAKTKDERFCNAYGKAPCNVVKTPAGFCK